MMRIVPRGLAALLVIYLAASAIAEEPSANEQAKSSGSNPFKFTFGLQEKGGVGASLKGQDVRLLGGGASHATFVISAVDAHWDSKADSPDQAMVSLKPGMVLFRPKAGLFYDLAATLDVSQRFGQFKTTDDKTGNVSQTLAGVNVIWIPRIFHRLVEPEEIDEDEDIADCWFEEKGCPKVKAIPLDMPPTVTFTYYRAFNESTDVAALPKGIESDKIIGRFSGDLPIVRGSRVRVIFDLSATKPTSGVDRDLQKKAELALGVRMAKFTPIIKYVTGEEGGFKYDRQVLLGLLWRFVGLPAQ